MALDPRHEPPGGDAGSILGETSAGSGAEPRRPLLVLVAVSACALVVPILGAVAGARVVRAFLGSPLRVLGPLGALVPVALLVGAVRVRRARRR